MKNIEIEISLKCRIIVDIANSLALDPQKDLMNGITAFNMVVVAILAAIDRTVGLEK